MDASTDAVINKMLDLQFTAGRSADIQVDCADASLHRVFSRIVEQWTKVGAVEPHASVLSDKRYRASSIHEHLAEFRATGKHGIEQLDALAAKNEVKVNFGNLFELGCGVGRLTYHFASRFDSVQAWDISEGNLAVCRDYLREGDIRNVQTQLIRRIEEFDGIAPIDVFYSHIVLQHNPPPLQFYLLNKILSRIKPGGVFMFQTVTHHDRYAFDVDAYLNWQHTQDFEMHCLPMRHVMRCIAANGLSILDVQLERAGGFGLVSNTFFGVRPQ